MPVACPAGCLSCQTVQSAWVGDSRAARMAVRGLGLRAGRVEGRCVLGRAVRGWLGRMCTGSPPASVVSVTSYPASSSSKGVLAISILDREHQCDRAGARQDQPSARGRAVAPGRLPRPGDGVPRRLRCSTRSPCAPAARRRQRDRGRGGRGGRARPTPTTSRCARSAPLRDGMSRTGEVMPGRQSLRADADGGAGGDQQADPGRRRDGWRQRRRGGGARRLRRAVGDRAGRRASCPRSPRRSAATLPFALLGGTVVGRGRGEQLTPALAAQASYHWVLAYAERVPVHPAGVQDAGPAPRRARTSPRPELSNELMAALRAGDPDRLGQALSNDLQAPALSLVPGAAQDPRRRAASWARSARWSPGRGRPASSSPATPEHATDLAVQLSGAGVCRSVATGDRPGRRRVP